jgi:xanthine dehydrogenase accessory factor
MLSLLEAVRLLAEARKSAVSAVVATCVKSDVEDVIVPGARIFLSEAGVRAGSIDPVLDSLLIPDAEAALQEGRSRTLTYQRGADGWEHAPSRGGAIHIYYDVAARDPALIIVGAGHIALPLARMAKVLDYRVIVVDDRAEYANRERFPDADQILVGPYRETVASLDLTGDSSVVLVTRGHVHDQACLEEVLGRNVRYIGMIGSKRRVRTVLGHLQEEGADPAALRRVHAPVGLDIGAETPPEIAVAILAEMIKVRRGGRAASLSAAERRDA